MSTTGFVFATTGELYTTLARRAARSLRQIHPDAAVDLFTDQDIRDDVFDEVHLLTDGWFRPKMEALLTSRFDRTMYLDADVMVVADLSPAFELLDRFDMAATNDRVNALVRQHSRVITPAFPEINGGVLAMKKNDRTLDLVRRWRQEMQDGDLKFDQPPLRELLFDSDVRLAIMPPGYNLLTFNELRSWWGSFGAPRILHANLLHRRRTGPGDPNRPFTVSEMVGPLNALRVKHLLRADFHVSPDVPMSARRRNNPLEPDVVRVVRRNIAPIWHWLREGERRRR